MPREASMISIRDHGMRDHFLTFCYEELPRSGVDSESGLARASAEAVKFDLGSLRYRLSRWDSTHVGDSDKPKKDKLSRSSIQRGSGCPHPSSQRLWRSPLRRGNLGD
jgi:hypothetical protein